MTSSDSEEDENERKKKSDTESDEEVVETVTSKFKKTRPQTNNIKINGTQSVNMKKGATQRRRLMSSESLDDDDDYAPKTTRRTRIRRKPQEIITVTDGSEESDKQDPRPKRTKKGNNTSKQSSGPQPRIYVSDGSEDEATTSNANGRQTRQRKVSESASSRQSSAERSDNIESSTKSKAKKPTKPRRTTRAGSASSRQSSVEPKSRGKRKKRVTMFASTDSDSSSGKEFQPKSSKKRSVSSLRKSSQNLDTDYTADNGDYLRVIINQKLQTYFADVETTLNDFRANFTELRRKYKRSPVNDLKSLQDVIRESYEVLFVPLQAELTEKHQSLQRFHDEEIKSEEPVNERPVIKLKRPVVNSDNDCSLTASQSAKKKSAANEQDSEEVVVSDCDSDAFKSAEEESCAPPPSTLPPSKQVNSDVENPSVNAPSDNSRKKPVIRSVETMTFPDCRVVLKKLEVPEGRSDATETEETTNEQENDSEKESPGNVEANDQAERTREKTPVGSGDENSEPAVTNVEEISPEKPQDNRLNGMASVREELSPQEKTPEKSQGEANKSFNESRDLFSDDDGRTSPILSSGGRKRRRSRKSYCRASSTPDIVETSVNETKEPNERNCVTPLQAILDDLTGNVDASTPQSKDQDVDRVSSADNASLKKPTREAGDTRQNVNCGVSDATTSAMAVISDEKSLPKGPEEKSAKVGGHEEMETEVPSRIGEKTDTGEQEVSMTAEERAKRRLLEESTEDSETETENNKKSASSPKHSSAADEFDDDYYKKRLLRDSCKTDSSEEETNDAVASPGTNVTRDRKDDSSELENEAKREEQRKKELLESSESSSDESSPTKVVNKSTKKEASKASPSNEKKSKLAEESEPKPGCSTWKDDCPPANKEVGKKPPKKKSSKKAQSSNSDLSSGSGSDSSLEDFKAKLDRPPEKVKKLKKKRSNFKIKNNPHYKTDPKLRQKTTVPLARMSEQELQKYSRQIERSKRYLEKKKEKRYINS